MIKKRLPLEAWKRWAHKKFDLDSEFVEAVRRCTNAKKSFKEQLGLEKTDENPREKGWVRGERNKNLTFKENKPKPAWNKTRKNYTPEEKRLYTEKRNQATKGNNQRKVEHTDWNAAHKDIKPETRQQRGRAGQCTRCSMTNHTWRQCRRDAVISTVGQRKPFQTQKRGFWWFRTNRPQVSRTLRIQNQVPQQINQIVRPKSWETDMDES